MGTDCKSALSGFLENTPTYDSLLYNGKELIWYNKIGAETIRFPASSGAQDYQNSKYQNKINLGPIPEGTYSIDLTLNPNRIVQMFDDGESMPDFGIQKLPSKFTNSKGVSYSYENWGNTRARLTMISGNSFGRKTFYIHNSTKGFSSGCIEIGSGFIPRLLEYANHYGNILLTVKYPSSNSSTLGDTWKYKNN